MPPETFIKSALLSPAACLCCTCSRGVAKKPGTARAKGGKSGRTKQRSRTRRGGSSSGSEEEVDSDHGFYASSHAAQEDRAGRPPKAPRRTKTDAQVWGLRAVCLQCAGAFRSLLSCAI